MIIDISGIELLPGKRGSDCLGNGEHFDEFGNKIECCCDECDYMLCCFGKQSKKVCDNCTDTECPRAKGKKRKRI